MNTITEMKFKEKQAHDDAPSATAVHLQEDDAHVVGIGNLKVVIVQDGEFYFAQGLEIDYAAQGESVADVRANFEEGLFCTIHEHLRVFGKIDGFLKPAPGEVWKEMLYDKLADVKRYNQISWHDDISSKKIPDLPYEGINYIEQQEAA